MGDGKDLSVEEAVTAAAATAGRAVLFAGMTVCIALLGIRTVGVSTLSGAAIGASIAVAFPVAGALTLLPALIGLLGKRTLTRRQRAALARGETGFTEASRRWTGWASRVQRHRIFLGVGALGIVLALGAPFLSMRQGTADYSVDPTSTTTTTPDQLAAPACPRSPAPPPQPGGQRRAGERSQRRCRSGDSRAQAGREDVVPARPGAAPSALADGAASPEVIHRSGRLSPPRPPSGDAASAR
jgi:uncharacterized membrane protein YdfJ with MMPL/SSD domain